MESTRRVKTSIRTDRLLSSGCTNTRATSAVRTVLRSGYAPYRFTVCPAWTQAGVGMLSGRFGDRHSVSTKILTEPPAVRMYSTFPLVIQL